MRKFLGVTLIVVALGCITYFFFNPPFPDGRMVAIGIPLGMVIFLGVMLLQPRERSSDDKR